MDGDKSGDDHLVQDPALGCVLVGGGAAAAAGGKKGVGRDDHRLTGRGHPGIGGGHLQRGQGDLPRKDLHPFDVDGFKAGLLGHQVTDGVGLDGGVVLLQ